MSLYLTNDTIDPTDNDNVIKDIHPQKVQIEVQNQPSNFILQDIPPEINPVKKKPSQGPQNSPIPTEIGLLQSSKQLPKHH